MCVTKGREYPCRVFSSKRLMFMDFRNNDFEFICIFDNCIGCFTNGRFEIWFCKNHSVAAWCRRGSRKEVINAVARSSGLLVTTGTFSTHTDWVSKSSELKNQMHRGVYDLAGTSFCWLEKSLRKSKGGYEGTCLLDPTL